MLDDTPNTYYDINMKDKELLQLLLKNSWTVIRIKGSHHRLKKDGYQPITLPVHGEDVGKGLETAILKQAGLK